MSREKTQAKVIRISLFLIVAVLAAFFYLGRNNSSGKFDKFNSEVSSVINWLDNTLGLNIQSDKNVFVKQLEDSLLEVHMIDVGQGESILIRTKNNDVLIDAGERNVGQDVVDYLNKQGVKRLELVIVTHPHSDHVGGMAEVIRNFDVGQVIMPEIPDELVPASSSFSDFLEAVSEKDLTIFSSENGTNYTFDDAKLTFLAVEEEKPDLNNISAVLRLDVDSVSFLFTGDAEKWLEERLVESGENLEADVLNLGHHGSSTSTSDEFLDKVNPEIAGLSCGIDNSYGHPHREVVEKLDDRNILVYRTDLDGSIIFETNGSEIAVTTERG